MNEPPTPAEIEAFEADQREGVGDRRMMSMGNDNFWADRLALPQPEYAPASGEAYRAERQWNSAIYRSPEFAGVQKANQKASLYDGSGPKQLGDYDSAMTGTVTLPAKWAFEGITALAYIKRVAPFLQHLDQELSAAQIEMVRAAYDKAVELDNAGMSHEQLRDHLEGKATTTGLFGNDPAANARAWSERQAADNEAKYGFSEYQAVNPQADALNRLAANRQAAEAQRGAAVAARYGHQQISRPSGDGFIVTTN